ncbi:MAG: isoprenylcysteine carboxylmethyltransferase family protein [Acidimicrobiales bacterium]
MIRAVVALVGSAGFLVYVFVVRTDRSRWVRFASRADAASGALLALGVLCALGTPALMLIGRLDPATTSATVGFAGALVLATGIAIAVVAQRQLGAAWRPGIDPDDRVALVTSGLYHRSRNPFYLGWIVANIGAALLVPTVAEVVAFALLIAALEVVVRFVEEPALRASHGAAFTAYTAKTRRFI